MTKLRWIALVALLAISGNSDAQPPTPSAGPPQTVRVAFWNIQWFPGRHPNASVASERAQIAIREESMQQLVAHIHEMNKVYGKLGSVSCVVGGDFNTAPNDPRFANETTTRTLRDNGFSWCWENIPFAQRITLPADKLFPAACFDHIFVRNAKINSARLIETSRRSSDHNAIFAELQL